MLAKKRSRLIDVVLAPAPSPLQSKGDSEDKVESSGDSAAAARSPAAPAKAVLERVMPAFSVQFSEPETESDDETIPKTHAATGSATEAEKHAKKTASSSSGGEEEDDVNVNVVDSDVPAKGKQVAAEGNTDDSDSSDSSADLISQSVPSEIAEALGMSHAKLIGGQVVGKIRFESGRHERDYLAEAGGSFCFPLMERRLMLTGARNAL